MPVDDWSESQFESNDKDKAKMIETDKRCLRVNIDVYVRVRQLEKERERVPREERVL